MMNIESQAPGTFSEPNSYQALLLVSFGGPDGPQDVIPFLDNVLRGKPVPEARKLEVAEHYLHFGGVSPINQQNKDLIQALEVEFQTHKLPLRIYWGNRNWHPTLSAAIEQMRKDGVERALAFFTSMFSCYSGCKQYRENILAARKEVGEAAPEVHKLRMGFNHPGFIQANAERLKDSLNRLGTDAAEARVLFTAHSIPLSMAENAKYELQLNESMRLVAEATGISSYELVYQSRSGSPQVPWLGPDVCERIVELADEGLRNVVLLPIGFVSDHMEVLFDLDTEARELCEAKGIRMERAASAGTHPAFIRMVRELAEERMGLRCSRESLGSLGPWHDVCPAGCCSPGSMAPLVKHPA